MRQTDGAAVMRCSGCGHQVVNRRCDSCNLYNAAVAAQRAAASAIAKAIQPDARGAYLNEYGVFAWVGDRLMQLGTPEQAAPFASLTTAARATKTFWDPRKRRKACGT